MIAHDLREGLIPSGWGYCDGMRLTIASIAGRARSMQCDALVAEYMKHTSAYLPIFTEVFRTSEAFFEMLSRQAGARCAVLAHGP